MKSTSPDIKKQAVKGFIKVFSCAHSMIIAASEHHNMPIDINFLKASTGFAAGLSTMGDVCGMVNGGVLVLGKNLSSRYPQAHERWKVIALCNNFYRRTESSVGTCNCGKVHGGRHLANNLRRALLTGKTVKCMEMLYKGSGIISDIISDPEAVFVHDDAGTKTGIKDLYAYFQCNGFHCCRSTLNKIQEVKDMDSSFLDKAVEGFIGGIGFSGTLCGAVTAGVLAIGLRFGIDPRRSGYKDTLRVLYQGLLKSDKVFRDEKVFKAARAFTHCQAIYKMVEENYGNCDCKTISGLDITNPAAIKTFIDDNGIEKCQRLSETIARETASYL
ncbi:MAG: C-GCAxxG-C-C family protein [Deltaproteobacteria bacterium]|nr:C-GCAxxG-C-C family protein [Deltaproteobacteria bacterium]